ncbi:MAG: glycosyltransferase family 2 protein, partial [Lactobacillus iners]|nr:glycosyltransferase family 2 protein [Lactobacillus iners]
MKSDITVIVPMYNVEKYVKKCFESLENQTYSNFEVLAINDGSPDNSSKYA